MSCRVGWVGLGLGLNSPCCVNKLLGALKLFIFVGVLLPRSKTCQRPPRFRRSFSTRVSFEA